MHGGIIMGRISIIMPLFNAEKYLVETLQSVENQTYKDFELICIDDCSSDETRKILQQFQREDSRIRILENKQRFGAALSRNRGLKAAQGKYVVFLDGDDVFEEEMLEKAQEAMEKCNVDLVMYEYKHVLSSEMHKKKVIDHSELYVERYCIKPFSIRDFEPRESPMWSSSPCNKMFRRNLLDENQLEFQNLPSFNDVYFVRMALFCAKKIIVLNDRRIMVYARDHFEPSRISSDRNSIYAYYAAEKLIKELKKRCLLSEYAKYLYHILPLQFINALKADHNEKRRKNTYAFLQNEGVLKCIEYGKKYYNQIDCYDLYLLESFLNKSYESRWFDFLDTYFQVYLKKNGDKMVVPFIQKKLLQNKTIILWGVGKNGIYFLNYLINHFIKIFAVVDRDTNKQGTIVCGYEVLKPESLSTKVDYILVTSKEVYQDVEKEIGRMEAVLVNVYDMVMEQAVSMEMLEYGSI